MAFIWLRKKERQYLRELLNMTWNSKTMGWKVETPTAEEMRIISSVHNKLY